MEEGADCPSTAKIYSQIRRICNDRSVAKLRPAIPDPCRTQSRFGVRRYPGKETSKLQPRAAAASSGRHAAEHGRTVPSRSRRRIENNPSQDKEEAR